jgi:hypothetical protein
VPCTPARRGSRIAKITVGWGEVYQIFAASSGSTVVRDRNPYSSGDLACIESFWKNPEQTITLAQGGLIDQPRESLTVASFASSRIIVLGSTYNTV